MAGIIEGVTKKEIKAVYLLGVDEIDMSYFGDAFVVYQGHHGDIGAHRADVVLPGVAYTEKDGLYVNTEGRVQEARRAVFPKGEAKEDWSVIAMVAERLGKKLPYASQQELRARLIQEFPQFAQLDVRPNVTWKDEVNSKNVIKAEGFDYPVRNFYMTDPISRASKTMAQCSELKTKTVHGKKAA
jgi:NADH-quinone oxidoreductase subunit G